MISVSPIVNASGQKFITNFKAASTTSSELAQWQPRVISAASATEEKPLIEGRAQHLVHNNGFVSGAKRTEQDSVVGSSYKLSLKPNYRLLGISHKEAERWASEIELRFHQWADSPDNFIDASRNLTFTQILRLAVGTEFIQGEFMMSREWIPDFRSEYATCFNIVEPERVATPANKRNDKNVTQGVISNRYGAAIGYHVRKGHPDDPIRSDLYNFNYQENNQYQRVNKYNQYGWRNFIHQFDIEKAGQKRGMSRLAAMIQKAKMLDRYEDVELEAAIMSATYALVLESELGADSIFQALSGGQETNPLQQMLQQKMKMDETSPLLVNGLKIPHLFPGEKLTQAASNHPNKSFAGFEAAMLRHSARATGQSYEQYTGDYTQTTYSSARASIIESWKGVLAKRVTINKVATIIFRLWLDEAIARNKIKLPVGVKDYWPNRDSLSKCTWIGTGKGDIDELKAAKANKVKLETGETTHQKIAADHGDDWQDVMEQRTREALAKVSAMEKLGVKVTDEDKIKLLGFA